MKPTDRDLAFVRRLGDKALNCRGNRHQWDTFFFDRASKGGIESKYGPNVIVKRNLCLSCGAKLDAFFGTANARGAAQGKPFKPFDRRYIHPDGYLWSSADTAKGKPEPEDYHREMYERFQRQGRRLRSRRN